MGLLLLLILLLIIIAVVARQKGRGEECDRPLNEDDGPIDGYDT